MHTLFISDLHLCEQRPDLIRALLNFLQEKAVGCDQLYLLGDIFDAWIGDDYPAPALTPLIAALRQLSDAGTEIYLQHGNRDFLLGPRFAEQVGAILLPEETTITLPDGEIALIMHGDQLCIDDVDYQSLRKTLRAPEWQAAFLAKPIEERLAIAQQLRAASREKTAEKSTAIMDVNASSVRQALDRAQCDLLIHGHTHRPAIHQHQRTATTGTRVVLGDWDRSLWYLECDEDGCRLLQEPIPAN